MIQITWNSEQGFELTSVDFELVVKSIHMAVLAHLVLLRNTCSLLPFIFLLLIMANIYKGGLFSFLTQMCILSYFAFRLLLTVHSIASQNFICVYLHLYKIIGQSVIRLSIPFLSLREELFPQEIARNLRKT